MEAMRATRAGTRKLGKRLVPFLIVSWLPAISSMRAETATIIPLRPPVWIDADDHPIDKPQERSASELYAIVHNSWLRSLDLVRQFSAGPAVNVNAWDEVPDSSWFTNRIGLHPSPFGAVERGLDGAPPAPGSWKVLRINDVGYTPKLNIEDASGHRYVLKFDVPGVLERNSAAERISTLVMNACGYNVPHNSIVFFRPSDLYRDERAFYLDSIGRRRPLEESDLAAALDKLERLPDGRYRGLASLFLKGEDVGKFLYSGTRKDDPNDYIPHEFRRELRGLKVIASWINHTDVKDVNAMDVFLERDGGKGYVRHYFIDFGSTLGSGDFKNGPYRVGHEYLFDGTAIGKSFVTLGFWKRPWETHGRILFSEVGYFDWQLFEPEKWKPNYPNLAFLAMDDADGYWGAKIVTSFDDAFVQELAASGAYSRPKVTRHIQRVLEERRNAIGRYWFGRVTPLEDFELSADDGNSELSFVNLAVTRGFWSDDGTLYRYWVLDAAGRLLLPLRSIFTSNSSLPLPEAISSKPESSTPDRWGRRRLAMVFIQAKAAKGESWALPVAVSIGTKDDSMQPQVLGWNHGVQVEVPTSTDKSLAAP